MKQSPIYWTLFSVIVRLVPSEAKELAKATFPLLSLRGAEGDEAISGEGNEIATPRLVGARNDKTRRA